LKDTPLHNEQALIRLVAENDEGAFASLLRHFWNKVYTQANVYLKSAPLAQEITQDVFIKIWIARVNLPGINNFSSYLFIITRNEVISALRKKGREPITPAETLQEDGWIPDLQLQYKESYKLLLEGIEALPPVRSRVFKMSRLEGLTYDEIGARLNISRNGVKDHIVKALLFLRNYLSTHTGEMLLILILLQKLSLW
jgi:RNA polymerase sigma factor (sigma-70 family)